MMRLAASLSLACVLGLGCSRGPSTLDASDFELEVRTYNWEVGGWDHISVDAAGHGEYVYIRGVTEQWPLDRPNPQGETEQTVRVPHWFFVEWDASPAQLRELQELLDARRFFALRAQYDNPLVHDGRTTTYALTAQGHSHAVECINRFPRAVEALDDYLDEIKPPGAPGPLTGERELSKAELIEMGLIAAPPAQ